MWLDFVLPLGSGTDFTRKAALAAESGTPLNVGIFHTHTSSFLGASLMSDMLTAAGYEVNRADLERETLPLKRRSA
jgi:hypothetical protein